MISLDATVEDVIIQYPGLGWLFVGHRMLCVGCDIARFHTLREVADMYELNPELFLAEIQLRLKELEAGNP